MKNDTGTFRLTPRQGRERPGMAAVWIGALFLLAVLLPLFVIARYNYPSNDDFAYVGAIYGAIKSGGGVWDILKAGWGEAKTYYLSWQGRYFDDLISALGVGTVLPEYYFLGTYFTLSLFAAAAVSLIRSVTFCVCKWDSGVSWLCAVLLPAMQILYVPYASEAFFWYVGATGYTMTYALLLFFIEALIGFYLAESKKKRVVHGAAAVLLAVMLGGTNYAAALLTAELLFVACLFTLLRKKRCFFLWGVFAEYAVCFCFNVFSPGNKARMGNVESLGVMGSVLASLRQGAVFLKEWFRLPVIILLAALFLLGAYQVAKMEYPFPLPALVTVVSFGLFSSLMTPPFYAGATWGPGRLINLIYFTYYFFLAGNLLYWTGWLCHRVQKIRKFLLEEKCVRMIEKAPLPLMLCFLLMLLCCFKLYGLQSTSSASAFLSLVKGEARQYRIENEARWEILTDESIMDAELEDFSVKPYVLYHDDIVADASDWRNYTMGSFFGKNSVKIKQ